MDRHRSIYSSVPRSNPRPQKIFCIGLSKTGTTSLCRALQLLNYTVVDFDVGLANIHLFDAATDVPVAEAFEQLDRDYPGSRFIYTVRDYESWLISAKRHWKLTAAAPIDPETVALYERVYGVPDYGFDPDLFRAAYARHDKRVRRYFADRELLVLNICAGEGWAPLCAFLGHPIPNKPFPTGGVPMRSLLPTRTYGPWRQMRAHLAYKLALTAAGIAPTPLRRLMRQYATKAMEHHSGR